jgi:DNA-binding transcriptional LysR family regulator
VADEARAILVERSNFNPSLMNRTFLIQANDYVVHILGSRLVAKLQELAPLSTLCFLAEGSEDIEAYRNDQIEFDLGVPGPLGPEVISQALFTERFVCAYRAKPKTRNTQMSLREFCERPHIIVSRKGKSSVLIDDELFRIGNRRSVVAIVATFFEGLDIAASSDCLVAAPKKLVVWACIFAPPS